MFAHTRYARLRSQSNCKPQRAPASSSSSSSSSPSSSPSSSSSEDDNDGKDDDHATYLEETERTESIAITVTPLDGSAGSKHHHLQTDKPLYNAHSVYFGPMDANSVARLADLVCACLSNIQRYHSYLPPIARILAILSGTHSWRIQEYLRVWSEADRRKKHAETLVANVHRCAWRARRERHAALQD
jgi:hypothetical protein